MSSSSPWMVSYNVPLEVCEAVIDYCAPHQETLDPFNATIQWRLVYIEDAARTLEACALTCRDWTDRSLFHYYSTCLILRKSEDVDWLLDTVARRPHLATLVRHLFITPWEGSSSANRNHVTYVPFTRTELVQKLQSLRAVVYVRGYLSEWPYPMLWNNHFAQYRALATLFLSAQFRRPIDICRLVWALETLQSLFLHVSFDMIHGTEDPLDPGYMRLRSLASRRLRCRSLSNLVINWTVSESPTFPYEHAFGTSVIRFGLCFGETRSVTLPARTESRHHARIEHYISNLGALEELLLGFNMHSVMEPKANVHDVVSWISDSIIPRTRPCKRLRRVILQLTHLNQGVQDFASLLFAPDNHLGDTFNKIPTLRDVAVHVCYDFPPFQTVDLSTGVVSIDQIRNAMRNLKARMSVVVGGPSLCTDRAESGDSD